MDIEDLRIFVEVSFFVAFTRSPVHRSAVGCNDVIDRTGVPLLATQLGIFQHEKRPTRRLNYVDQVVGPVAVLRESSGRLNQQW